MAASRVLSVKLAADVRELVTQLGVGRKALGELATQAEKTDTVLSERAGKSVASAAKQRAALEGLAAEYLKMAQQAERGSNEQVAAAELAARAQKRLATSVDLTSVAHAKHAGELRNVQGELEKTSRGVLSASGAFEGFGRSIAFASGTFLGAAGFTEVVKSSVAAASDLHEQINKTDVVFGKSADSILEWSKKSATAFGQSRSEALAAAGSFGAMLTPLGVAPAKAAAMSRSLVQLAGDMASFNNASPEDTLRAIQSGLAGQVRPLREYGVQLSATRIAAEALDEGLVKSNVDMGKVEVATRAVDIAQAKLLEAQKKYPANSTQVAQAQNQLQTAQQGLTKAMAGHVPVLDATQKMLASYGIIMKDTKIQQGDFARTSGGLANQQRILSANIKNTEEAVGTALLPVVLKVTDAINDWLGKSENQEKIQRTLNDVIQKGKLVIDDTWPVVKTMAHWANEVADAVGGWKNAIEIATSTVLLGRISKLAGAIGGARGGLAAALSLAKGESGGLLANLKKLQGVGKVGIQIAVVETLLHAAGVHVQDSTSTHDVYKPGTQFGTDAKGNSYPLSHFPPSQREQAAQRYKANIARSGGGSVAPPAAIGQGRNLQLPSKFTATHDTSGLPNFPAVDIFASPGKQVGAPENGAIIKTEFIQWDIAKRVGGWTIYYLGFETGNTYFLTHFASVSPVGNYAKGEVIGTVAAVPGAAWQSHIHEGEHQGTYTPSGATMPTSRTVGATSAAASTATATTAAATTASTHGRRLAVAATMTAAFSPLPLSYQIGIDRASLTKTAADDIAAYKAAIAYVTRELGGLNGQNLDDALQELKSLKDGLTGLEKPAKATAAVLSDDLGKGFKSVQVEGNAAGKIIENIGYKTLNANSKMTDNVAKAADTTAKALVAPLAFFSKWQADAEKRAAAATQKAITAAKSVLSSATSGFESAWGRIADAGLAAFDKETQIGLAKVQTMVHVQGYSPFLFGGDITQTPTELLLQQMQDSHDEASRQQAIEDAQDALKNAQTDDDKKQAQQQLNDALYAEKVAGYEKQAQAERTAADKQLTDAQNAYQDQRDLQRTALQDQLDDMEKQLEKGTTSTDLAMQGIRGVFAQFGIDLDPTTGDLGKPIIDNLNTLIGNIATGLDAVNKAQAALAAAQGNPAPKQTGPVAGTPGVVTLPNGETVPNIAAINAQLAQIHGAFGFADGGIVKGGRGGVLGVIGEGIHDEAIIPLPKGRSALGGTTVVINIDQSRATVLSKDRGLARELARIIKPELGRIVGI